MENETLKDFVLGVTNSLERVESNLAAGNLAAARMSTQLDAALSELERGRNERAALEQRLTRLEARGEGAAQSGATWQSWLGVLVAVAALAASVVGLFK